MSEINLLQSNNDQYAKNQTNKVLNFISILLLVLVVVAYAALFFLVKNVEKSNVAYAEEKESIQQNIMGSVAYPQFVSHQVKLKNLEGLLKSHLGWCSILPSFGNVTLKTAVYNKFDANADGSATISGVVPDFQELAKLIQGFQHNDDQFVKDVKLVNVGLGSAEKNEIQYTINVTFNKEVLQKSVEKCN